MEQWLISDICDNCNRTLIYADYHENGIVLPEKQKMQVSLEEVSQNQMEKYQKMVSSASNICKCDDPFPNEFSWNP